MHKFLAALLLSILLPASFGTAEAGSFTVTPTRLSMKIGRAHV